ncbi:acyl-CoA dehydrogenase family protein [Rhodococcus koreensis]|uniref:acyl-CoA dehydrogenase family protein n=1 Tax=Rhodococcus koreensis TaxID=99653 RepID=UPI0019807221|nr:acyl-CoA dehydrogenase family protein [Rhodococcus koreensis]QSE86434.1 acyl-CoA dehydrogenase family protein [Rhodococcus koreensis]
MSSAIYEDVHEQYRDTVRTFIKREVTPHYARWEEEGGIDLSAFTAAINAGIYGLGIPEKFGGPGEADVRFRMVVSEEMALARATTFSIGLANQDDMVLVYLLDLGTDEQLDRWMPGLAAGEIVGAVAMTEPEAGSDLRGMSTMARRDGDEWVLSGRKTFITNGTIAGIVIVAARTVKDDGSLGFSLFVVEDGMPGFERGRPLQKVGLHSQDTGELFFNDVRLPLGNLLGTYGTGLSQLKRHLPRERLSTTLGAVADARAIFDLTAAYCFERKAFGQPIGEFQNTRFALAEMATELDIAETYVDSLAVRQNAGTLTATDAAKGKWWTTELQKRIVDRCVQLHGGYGYMIEYPVARAFIDSRVQTIYGGTTEIMKEIIGRDIASSFSVHNP